ncbi:9185_t:CDS:2 [Cetraspora pellucida]|uniref:9185_t:CDS:1 n=2 Tax=Cetraspora pellucida TaxID=1433469 RepID=A0ACA9JXL3_9GLOM|nr:9177_t:CDS:2 [Cetraspora pellucida]CAG8441254.1 9185_t:CDS:2 [Cetraspora pellucida]
MNKDLTIKTWDLPQTYTQEQAMGTNTPRSTALDFDQVFNFLEKLDDTLIGKLKQDNITQSQNSVDNPFTHATHNYRLLESEEGLEKLEEDLDTKKMAACFRAGQLDKEIIDGQKEIDDKQKEIDGKDAEIKTLVGEILTKKREKLNSYNLAKGFAKTSTEDNRREVMELVNINQLLLTIRYLENDGDATSISTVDAENTALTEIETILAEAGYSGGQTTYLVLQFRSLAYIDGGDGKYDIQQAISRIKAGKEENVSSQIKKHSKLTQVETLIKKVFADGKIKSEFLEEIKKSDATLVDLKTLLLKEPKDIITYIARFVYNQLDDSAANEKDKKKTQKKRRIAKKLNKTNESELTEQELNDSLYQIEIGEMTLDSKYYKADLSEITNQPEQNEEPK